MIEPALAADIEKALSELDRADVSVDPKAIVGVVTCVLASIKAGRVESREIKEEIANISDYIQAAKTEITAIGADEISARYLPTAAEELTAIVGATEEATNEIFEAVEVVEALSETMAPETAAQVGAAVTRIYEACSFQDITGQRVSKVVKVLDTVDERVRALLEKLGQVDPASEPAGEHKPVASDEELMNGPQLPGNAMSQADIDDLLASFD